MIDGDQRPDSSHHPLTSLSQITVRLRVFSNRRPFQILRSMADLLVRVREYVSDVIGHRFEKVRNGHRFEKLKSSNKLSSNVYQLLFTLKKSKDFRFKWLDHIFKICNSTDMNYLLDSKELEYSHQCIKLQFKRILPRPIYTVMVL